VYGKNLFCDFYDFNPLGKCSKTKLHIPYEIVINESVKYNNQLRIPLKLSEWEILLGELVKVPDGISSIFLYF
jgi:hypothetical protein